MWASSCFCSRCEYDLNVKTFFLCNLKSLSDVSSVLIENHRFELIFVERFDCFELSVFVGFSLSSSLTILFIVSILILEYNSDEY